jgi:hypothetical protein
LALTIGGAQAQTGYQIDVTTTYQTAPGPGIDFGTQGSPDTGYALITNNGASTFTGMITGSGTAVGGTDVFVTTGPGFVLAPGATVKLGFGPESSNQGGFNTDGPGAPQFGIQLSINGDFTLGADTENKLLQVFDKDIHSGVPRTNPFGAVTDAYVLQGGDPFGRDTGDAYETTQANGHFQFFEKGKSTPEPTNLAMVLPMLAPLGLLIRRKRS